MSCNNGNQVLDPYQSTINGLNKTVTSLENAADFIQPTIDLFDAAADAITTPTPAGALNTALNQFTAEAICASKTDLEPINQLTADCLYEATAAVKRYLKDITSILEEGTKLIVDIITLPEGLLFTYFQKVRGLTTDIKDLITAIDFRIECVALKTPDYNDQILGIETRVNDVIDQLRLEPDGSFSVDSFCADLSTELTSNIASYDTKVTELQSEIETTVSDTIDLSVNVNPKRYF
jgi:hypothetical protein